MTKHISIDEFDQEVDCVYKNEHFKVRDNGAVFKFARDGQRVRPTDSQWTFGVPGRNAGYLEIMRIPVHRIVASAFHGLPPTDYHVVDHIDTDKKNNQPKNLRWVTKLENILLDPITAKRVARRCGSVETFLNNPQKFQDKLQEPKLKWIGAITTETGQRTLKSLLALAGIDDSPSNGALDRWLVYRLEWEYEDLFTINEPPNLTLSKTPNALQLEWKTASDFLCCPQIYNESPLIAYLNNLEQGSIFATNERYTSCILKFAKAIDREALIILTGNPDGVNRWALAEVTFENDYFIHKSLGTFVTVEGGEKYYFLACGLEWTGGDTFDDYIR